MTLKQLTNSKAKDILKKLGYNKYYEHIPFIKDKLINSGDVVVHYPAGPTINDNGSVALIKKEKGTGFYLNYVDPK